jgi:hypothetical protein
MKTYLPIIFAFAIVGCATKPDYSQIQSVYTDQSPSSLSREQAFTIAKREAIIREGFTDEPRVPFKTTRMVTGTSSRINDGGWRVIARAMVCTNERDGANTYRDVPAAVVTINREGKIVGYTRHSMQEIYEAEQGAP